MEKARGAARWNSIRGIAACWPDESWLIGKFCLLDGLCWDDRADLEPRERKNPLALALFPPRHRGAE